MYGYPWLLAHDLWCGTKNELEPLNVWGMENSTDFVLHTRDDVVKLLWNP